jgi:hypothetical protein
MKRSSFLLVATFAVFAASACSKSEAPPAPAAAPAAAAKAPASDDRILKVPILPGYKYYAGGPVLTRDVHGRYRISGFNGEVQPPPSRGMIFGAKRDGDQIEYRVWGNGTPLGFHKGVMREGLYWEDYSEGFRMGKLVARERQTHDDAAKRSKVVTEDLDPETGELIRTKEGFLPYSPPVLASEDGDEESDDTDSAPAGIVAPGSAVPVPKAPPAAPAAPAAPGAAAK